MAQEAEAATDSKETSSPLGRKLRRLLGMAVIATTAGMAGNSIGHINAGGKPREGIVGELDKEVDIIITSIKNPEEGEERAHELREERINAIKRFVLGDN